jgi:hypothetical protein
LIVDDETSYAVAHVQLGTEPIAELAALSAGRDPERDWLAGTLPDGPLLAAGRPRQVSHLLWCGAELPEPVDTAEVRQALGSWSRVQRWQWFLASGLTPDSALPDIEAPDLMAGTVWLSRNWRALALRDGIAFVALTPWTPPSQDGVRCFHDAARVYVRTLHLDVLLLASLQLSAVHHYADETARIFSAGFDAATIKRLESEFLELRAGLWWENVAHRGRQTSDVLVAFQQQHRLPQLYEQIVRHLTDAARYIQAEQVAVAEAEVKSASARREREDEARTREELRQRQFERFIAIVSLIFLPVSIIFGAMALWANPSPRLFGVSLGLSLIFVGVMLAVSAKLRAAMTGHGGGESGNR